MVFVPWRQLGICPFWAMHKTECKYGELCRWAHPPQEQVKRIWDWYTVQQATDVGVGTGLDYGAEFGGAVLQDERYGQVAQPDGTRSGLAAALSPSTLDDLRSLRELENHPSQPLPPGLDGMAEYAYFETPRQAPPQRVPKQTDRGAREQAAPMAEQLDCSRPSSSDFASLPPHMSSDGPYPHRFAASPTQTAFSTSPSSHPAPFEKMPRPKSQRDSPVYSVHPESEPRGDQPRDRPFDPQHSRNPFINGSLAYRFVWGDPLCVRCGYTGHLPKQCTAEALTYMEQSYLYRLMREEQNRSKAERGLDTKVPTKESLAPSIQIHGQLDHWNQFEADNVRITGASLLDVPISPREEGEIQHETRAWEDDNGQGTIAAMYDGAADDLDNSVHFERQDAIHTASLDKDEVRHVRRRSDKSDVKAPGRLKRDLLGEPRRHLDKTPASIIAPTTPPAFAPSFLSTGPKMGATKRLSNGEAKAPGPHPSTMRVSAPYLTQSTIEKRLQPASLDPQERSQAEAREDSVRLQGVTWLDNVRRALQLPVKTFTTACVYYHKFRLAHAAVDYSWSDAAAASLLTSCKNEDTLKKSRDILAAAHNLRQPAAHEHVGADDPIFDAPGRVVIGLERLVLESGGFDFRSRSPHQALVKIGKSLPESEDLKRVSRLAWTILTDLHRTFAPLKQTSATLALASLELAVHFQAAKSEDGSCTVKDDLQALNLNKWHTTRDEVMETLLDALDLYTHNTASTILGTKYSLDDFLRIRLALNKECADSNLSRYTVVQPPPSPDNANETSSTLRVTNGHPTPISPPQAGTTQSSQQPNGSTTNQPSPEGPGTLRFMLDPQRATDERTEINRYFTEEWEEYEEEIEVPIPRDHSRDRHHRDRPDRDRHGRPPHDDRRGPLDGRGPLDARGPPPGPRSHNRDRMRERLADREREAERERARLRDRERERRYDERGHDDRPPREPRHRDSRYDERGHRERDRRHDYDDRRRDRR